MSGHSKWSSIKHQKGAADAKRGKLFTKLTKEIIVAVRAGGPSPDSNYHLRLAVQKARDNNMPLDNVERAIKRGEGTLEGTILAEFSLEGYGPGGGAILVDILSDNRNRAVQEVRNAFTKSGGNLGENGSVAWLFEHKGLIVVETENKDTEELELQAIDAGADDVKPEKGYVEIYTDPKELEKVKNNLEKAGVTVCSSDLAKIPKSTMDLDDRTSIQTLRLLNKLEELDDTRSVCSNVNFSDESLEKFNKA
jgi:YebC/PmpR family DNA-binding regulatory protein